MLVNVQGVSVEKLNGDYRHSMPHSRLVKNVICFSLGRGGRGRGRGGFKSSYSSGAFSMSFG